MNSTNVSIYWFLLPLVAAIALVYAASRREDWPRIWKHAARSALTMIMILVVVTVLLTIINGFI